MLVTLMNMDKDVLVVINTALCLSTYQWQTVAASREKSVVFCVVRAYRLLRRAIRGRASKIFNACDGLRVSGQPIAKLNELYCSFLCSSSCFEC